MPQLAGSAVTMTYGNMYGYSVARSSKNPQYAIEIVKLLTSQSALKTWVTQSKLPSVRRDALALDPSNAEAYTFALSSLWAKGWRDPHPARTAAIFSTMIESVTSGRSDSEDALTQAHRSLQEILGQ
jgi:ABC-type glycerol-3-phosphate transport system substrate-binding protein